MYRIENGRGRLYAVVIFFVTACLYVVHYPVETDSFHVLYLFPLLSFFFGYNCFSIFSFCSFSENVCFQCSEIFSGLRRISSGVYFDSLNYIIFFLSCAECITALVMNSLINYNI